MLHAEVALPNLSLVGAASIAAVNAAANTGDLTNNSFLGALFVLDVTTLTGTAPTLQLVLEGKDALSGKYVNLASFTAVTTAGTYAYIIGTFAPALAGAPVTGGATSGITDVVFGLIPNTFRVRVVGAGTAITNATFTTAAHYIYAIG